MERRGHVEHHRALGAFGFGDLATALDRGLVAGNHDLARAIVIRHLAHLSLRAFLRGRGGVLERQSEQSRHRAFADRNRLLHREPARAQKPRGIAHRNRAGGGERGIFTERMPGDEFGVAFEIEAGFGFQHADHRDRHRHQAGLGVLGERQLLDRAVPQDRRELLAERGIHLLEHRARRREGVGQGLAHADGLAALARKRESRGHERPCCPLFRKFSESGPKDTATASAVKQTGRR